MTPGLPILSDKWIGARGCIVNPRMQTILLSGEIPEIILLQDVDVHDGKSQNFPRVVWDHYLRMSSSDLFS